jgi:hypothetical protein
MSLSDLASLGSFVSGIAVLISLIYLALQVRQAEKSQQANVRQQRASRNVAINMGLATEPSLVAAFNKLQTGAKDISSDQFRQCLAYAFALFSSFEDMFLQHRDGLTTDRDFDSVVNAIGRLLGYPGYRLLWKRLRTAYGKQSGYAEFVDSILAATPVVSADPDLAEVLRDWATEAALIGAAPSAASVAAR